MIEALFTLVGTILGFFLSEYAQSRREGREQKRLSAAAKEVLSTEIQINFRFLQQYSETASQIADVAPPGEDERVRKHRAAHGLLGIPLPEFRTHAFESLLAELGKALSARELKACFAFYDGLSKLAAIRAAIAAAQKDQEEEWRLASGGSSFVPMDRAIGMARRFEREAPALWDQFYALLNELLAVGNPLSQLDAA